MITRLLIGLLTAFAAAGAHAAGPNVIVVLIDDQGYGDLSCHGNPVLKTPNMDKLHGESIRFTDFHVAPMCTPTRGQIMCGQDCLRSGAMNVSSGRSMLRLGIPTMADIFAASGWKTGQFGKWHLGDCYPYRPIDRGFQEAVWFPSSHIPSAADYWNNCYFDDHYKHNGKIEQYKGYCTDVWFDEAMKWMRARTAAGERFFCYLPTNAPHGPLFVPEKYRNLYKGQNEKVARFFGMIANIDDNLARLDAMLRETGVRDDTILIFMTDNGGTGGVSVYNAGMRGKKIDLYEGGHRVPCFVRWPAGKLRPAGDIAELTHCQDLLPTLIDLCGLKRPENAAFDGTSLADLLRGKQEHLPDRMLVSQFSRLDRPRPKKGDACVLWNKWRLVSDKELFDIATDPGQKTDVADKHPDIVAKMRAHYEKWWAGIEPRVNELSPIHVGSDAENPVMLSACDWQDVFLDQSVQVRKGEHKNGPWGIFVEREGEYEISLRRWPVEADAAIAAPVPGYQAVDGVYPVGIALPIAQARLSVSGFDESRKVAMTDKAVTFTVKLNAGPFRLQTWFSDADGKEICGAYYVYVRRK